MKVETEARVVFPEARNCCRFNTYMNSGYCKHHFDLHAMDVMDEDPRDNC